MVELGRPNTGTTLANAEKIIQTLMAAGAKMAEQITHHGDAERRGKGIMKEEIKNERVLSCIVEAMVKIEDLERALEALKQVSLELDTVFSLGLVTRMEEGFISPIEPTLRKMGLAGPAQCKDESRSGETPSEE